MNSSNCLRSHEASAGLAPPVEVVTISGPRRNTAGQRERAALRVVGRVHPDARPIGFVVDLLIDHRVSGGSDHQAIAAHIVGSVGATLDPYRQLREAGEHVGSDHGQVSTTGQHLVRLAQRDAPPPTTGTGAPPARGSRGTAYEHLPRFMMAAPLLAGDGFDEPTPHIPDYNDQILGIFSRDVRDESGSEHRRRRGRPREAGGAGRQSTQPRPRNAAASSFTSEHIEQICQVEAGARLPTGGGHVDRPVDGEQEIVFGFAVVADGPAEQPQVAGHRAHWRSSWWRARR
jgi:hypothetical protein